MHLGVLEIDQKNHVSMLYNYVRIAAYNEWELTLFTTEEIYEILRNDLGNDAYQHNIVLLKKDESVLTYFRKIQRYLLKSSVDTLVFLTLQSHFLPFTLVPFKGTKRVITVHNANTWINGNVIRNKKHYLKKLYRKLWLRRADAVVVNSNNMLEFVKTTDFQKPVVVVPFSMKKNRQPKYKRDKFTITYPGTVDCERKCYTSFIEMAKCFPNFDFILLGKLLDKNGNKDIVEFLHSSSNTNITFFEDYVSHEEFNHFLLGTDCLFSELVTEFNLSDYSEVYGTSKDSGISYLMEEFELPCVLNSNFRNFEHLNSLTYYFSNQLELKNNIEYIYNNLDAIKSQVEFIGNRELEVAVAFKKQIL